MTVYFALTWRLIFAIRSGFSGNTQPGASPGVRIIFAAIFFRDGAYNPRSNMFWAG